jgi:hypothetical protein
LRVTVARRSENRACRSATGVAAAMAVCMRTTQDVVPQGPSHMAPIPAQLPKAMAMGPKETHATSTTTVIRRRELMLGGQYCKRSTACQGPGGGASGPRIGWRARSSTSQSKVSQEAHFHGELSFRSFLESLAPRRVLPHRSPSSRRERSTLPAHDCPAIVQYPLVAHGLVT